jgi:cell division protein FtsQ
MKPANRRVAVTTEDDRPSASGVSDGPVAAPSRATLALGLLRSVLGAALVLGLSTTVAWAARKHILASPRFAIGTITVTGAHHRTDEELRREAGIALGTNVFSLDLGRARAKLLADPWIETATLSTHLPGKVFVEVKEREAVAVVTFPEAYLASRDGRVFKKVEVGDPVDLPVVTGLSSQGLFDDREGTARTITRALDLASEYEHGPLASRAPLEEVHVGNGGELTLVIGKDGVSVALGRAPFRRKLEETVRVFSELERRGAHASLVMLDDEARPDRVVVRTR